MQQGHGWYPRSRRGTGVSQMPGSCGALGLGWGWVLSGGESERSQLRSHVTGGLRGDKNLGGLTAVPQGSGNQPGWTFSSLASRADGDSLGLS